MALLLAIIILLSSRSAAAATLPPAGLLPPLIRDKLHVDPNITARFATDYGHLTNAVPAAVLTPSSPSDVAVLLRSSVAEVRPLAVAARGHGHSVRGQASAAGGVVVDMASLGRAGRRINVSDGFVDAGGEQLWIDVLRASLERGLAPPTWTDYLYLTVGGTLSNAGIGGQAFRHGPQIANVDELDVITGNGEMLTCSQAVNSDLFYGVLGGLGQFGIITRARIKLVRAPQRVRWLRLFYSDFNLFTRDQELLISMAEGGFDYVEGQVLLDHKGVNNSSFPFSDADVQKINGLTSGFEAVYFLEGGVYYNSASSVDQELDALLNQLSFDIGFNFTNDVTFFEFLSRVPELLDSFHHPWLNLFIPKSRARDFDLGVFKGILKNTDFTGLILMYPMNKNRWDPQMSAEIPNEDDVMYTVGLLRTTSAVGWRSLDMQNDEILKLLGREGIQVKQYLPHFQSRAEWAEHFGPNWDNFVQLKNKYDPKHLLSPGQNIF